MTGSSIKELWTIEGRPTDGKPTHTNALYGFTGNPLIPYQEGCTSPDFCIFCVRSTDGTEAGWLFQNDEIDGRRISEKLFDYINGEKRTIFYRCQNPHTARTLEHLDLHDLLYAFKYGVTVEQVKELRVRLVDAVPRLSFSGTQIFDLSWNNLKSNQKPTTHFISNSRKDPVIGTVLHGARTMAVYLPELKGGEYYPRYFSTEFDPNLYVVLCKATSRGVWEVVKGALKISFCDSDNSRTKVSFGEIVGTFYRGMIDITDPIASILRNHAVLMGNASAERMIVFDHLTHDKTNNFSWALAEIPEAINKRLRGRDKIRPPYFFLTVYDQALGKYKVKMGAYGLGWEQRYLFDDLAYSNPSYDDVFTPRYQPGSRPDNPLYVSLLEAFKAHIGKENTTAKSSYLSYWAAPERVCDRENMLTSMLEEPESDYEDALEALTGDGMELAFEEMPVL